MPQIHVTSTPLPNEKNHYQLITIYFYHYG